ncbi:transcriptional regulator [Candidatus Lokiarchaeum ossiferum]|uniref:transcriptional regulator n=1 Tax=Candidatus Lokiarchaeum ossiferum TaxID=2951803 RepID=UPI00352FCDF3
MDWELISYVLASNYRKKVLLSFKIQDALTPSQIKKITEIRLEHISKVLKELVIKNVIVCLTPKSRKGKIFSLTDNGNEILEYLEKSVYI